MSAGHPLFLFLTSAQMTAFLHVLMSICLPCLSISAHSHNNAHNENNCHQSLTKGHALLSCSAPHDPPGEPYVSNATDFSRLGAHLTNTCAFQRSGGFEDGKVDERDMVKLISELPQVRRSASNPCTCHLS